MLYFQTHMKLSSDHSQDGYSYAYSQVHHHHGNMATANAISHGNTATGRRCWPGHHLIVAPPPSSSSAFTSLTDDEYMAERTVRTSMEAASFDGLNDGVGTCTGDDSSCKNIIGIGSATVGGRRSRDAVTTNRIDTICTSSNQNTNTSDSGILPFPQMLKLEDVAQAVLSLRKADNKDDDANNANKPRNTGWTLLSPSCSSLSADYLDSDSCPGQEDELTDEDCNEFDIDVETSEGNDNNMLTADQDNDVASRLKRMAVCCRKYNISPKNFARVQNEGDCMILLPKRKSTERSKKLMKMRDQPDRTAKQATSSITSSTICIITGTTATRTTRESSVVERNAENVEAADATTVRRSLRSATRSTTRGDKISGSKKHVVVSRKNNKRKQPQQQSSTKVRRNKNSPSTPIYSRPFAELGEGWLIEGYARKTGSYKGHVDKYWISPSKRKFRSMAAARRFLAALKEFNGDEEKAYAMK